VLGSQLQPTDSPGPRTAGVAMWTRDPAGTAQNRANSRAESAAQNTCRPPSPGGRGQMRAAHAPAPRGNTRNGGASRWGPRRRRPRTRIGTTIRRGYGRDDPMASRRTMRGTERKPSYDDHRWSLATSPPTLMPRWYTFAPDKLRPPSPGPRATAPCFRIV
jgi:hypothetical protein